MAEVEDFDEDQAEEFYEYVYEYYGKGEITDDYGLNLTRDDIKKYCDRYIADPTNKDLFPYQLCRDNGEGFNGIEGDTIDRQNGFKSHPKRKWSCSTQSTHVPPPMQKHNLN